MAEKLSPWCKKAKIAMIQKDIGASDMAERLGNNRSYISSVLNGRVVSPPKTPELRSYYCKHECPIGRNLPLATQVSGLQGITVKILNSLDEDGVRSMKKQLLSIAEDGEITADEQEEFGGIVKKLEILATEISELRMLAEKFQK